MACPASVMQSEVTGSTVDSKLQLAVNLRRCCSGLFLDHAVLPLYCSLTLRARSVQSRARYINGLEWDQT